MGSIFHYHPTYRRTLFTKTNPLKIRHSTCMNALLLPFGCIPKPGYRNGNYEQQQQVSHATQVDKQKLWLSQQENSQTRYENLSMTRVKIILRDVTFFLEQNKLLNVTGIYRRGPVISKKNEFKQRINSDLRNITIDLQDWIDQPHTLTACIKDLLRELDEPLFMRANYERICELGRLPSLETISDEDFVEQAREVLDSLPRKNHEVMEILLDHLTQVVLCENSNSMSTYALAIIWSPCIIKPPCETPHQDTNLIEMGSRQNSCIMFLRKILDIRLKEKRIQMSCGGSMVSSLSRLRSSTRTNSSGTTNSSSRISHKSSTASKNSALDARLDHNSNEQLSRKNTCASESSSAHDKLSVSGSIKFAQQVCDRL